MNSEKELAMNEFKEIRDSLDIIDVARDMGLNINRSNMCCCPFHSERTPSMKFYGRDRGDNKFYCFGCGENGDVIDLTAKMYNIPVREAAQKLNSDYSLGIDFGGRNDTKREYITQPVQKQGFSAGQSLPKPKWERWLLLRKHEYLDKNRKKLAVKFIYRKPDGSKAASWRRYEGDTLVKGLNGLKMPLYHVHNLADKSKPIFIVEGEKDVETLERFGFVATTSPNGAGSKWLEEYSKELKDANVIIIADNDDVGYSHAVNCAESVAKYATTVKLVPSKAMYPPLKPNGDITDIYSVVGEETTKKLLECAIRLDKFYYSKNNPVETAKEKMWLNSAEIVARNYLRVLNKFESKYSEFPAGTQQSELYSEAVGNKDKIQYFSDTLSNGSEKDKHNLYFSCKDDFYAIALRLRNIREQGLDMTLYSPDETVALSKMANRTIEKTSQNHRQKGMRK